MTNIPKTLGEEQSPTNLRWTLDEARDLLWRVAGMINLTEYNEKIRSDARAFLRKEATNDD